MSIITRTGRKWSSVKRKKAMRLKHNAKKHERESTHEQFGNYRLKKIP